MTIRDYIRCYNKTFGYVEDKFGVDDLADLFHTISVEYCNHLDDFIRTEGVLGCLHYWGGDGVNPGTLAREKTDYDAYIDDEGVFHGAIRNCTSVGDVREKGQEPHHGKLTYCDHCEALYGECAAKYGIELKFQPEYNEDGTCRGNCTWYAKKVEG